MLQSTFLPTPSLTALHAPLPGDHFAFSPRTYFWCGSRHTTIKPLARHMLIRYTSSSPRYKESGAAKTAVTAILNAYTSLAVEFRSFVTNLGEIHDLIVIEGTIPIIVRGNEYHIPVNIWIPLTFPVSHLILIV